MLHSSDFAVVLEGKSEGVILNIYMRFIEFICIYVLVMVACLSIIAKNKIANPPQELSLPFKGSGKLKTREEVAAFIGSGQADWTWFKFPQIDPLSHTRLSSKNGSSWTLALRNDNILCKSPPHRRHKVTIKILFVNICTF
ncbi:hypothetical protein L1987_28479 [Smallanthus sonchifolius]|uniref:Uncharacterized protein n=1 Tax=Smallanthus sonchifolius TaxID=185202 RepID=A0ACB9HXC6_9ASTR|nr:hypothetical protein L1987_28479 [Smallanthus sonchifolius]